MPSTRKRSTPGWPSLISCIALLTLLQQGHSANPRLCVLIRAVPSQTVEALLWSLFSQQSAAGVVRAFVINTDPRQQGTSDLRSRTEAFSRRRFRVINQQVVYLPLRKSRFDKSLYAYDATDDAIDAISKVETGCEYLLVTNGDNLYSAYLLDAITPHMAQRVPLIGWDFVSHHLRNNTANTHIAVAIREKFIDLGSFAVRFDFYTKHRLRFVENARRFSGYCADFFAADYCMAEQVARLAGRLNSRVALLHSILMFHQ